jgi:cyclopropane-fatty-acyl-phospholipid synthase
MREDREYKRKIDLFLTVLRQSRFGKISVLYQNKKILDYQAPENGPRAEINIINKKCLDDFFNRGDLGWAESYIDKNWETANLTSFLEWGAKNFHQFSSFIRGRWYIILYLRLKHFLNGNTKKGSKKNIQYHYDLGNEFYKSWLDETMTYSSAIFKSKTQSLQSAQINKYKSLAELVNIKPGDSVLEVGCGWGGFSEFLAINYEANVTAITISENQYLAVKSKIEKNHLKEKVDVKLIDYRDLNGKFDKIVSIEMFEAVGVKYWKIFFKKLYENLKPGGCIGLQTITIDEKFFQTYKKFPDFIQTYIFPGGMLPSISAINEIMTNEGLYLDKKNMFGLDYAETLKRWRSSFQNSLNEIKSQGFNDTFLRMWNYYLSYCEGGFRSRNIDVGQFLIKKN